MNVNQQELEREPPPLWQPLLILLAVIAAYANSFGGVWHLDDPGYILRNEALRNLAYRIDVEDLPFFITAIAIQRETGGNLTEILDKLGHVIRERFKLYGKVRGITAMGCMTANMLAFWPLVMVGALYSVNPGYVEPLWRTSEGHMMVMICAALVGIGYTVCRKMAEIKV